MLKSKEQIAYNAQQPSIKSHVYIMYTEQMQMKAGRIVFGIEMFIESAENKLLKLPPMSSMPNYSRDAFNNLTKGADLDHSLGWVDCLFNDSKIDEIMHFEVGNNGDKYFGTTSDDWEIVSPK